MCVWHLRALEPQLVLKCKAFRIFTQSLSNTVLTRLTLDHWHPLFCRGGVPHSRGLAVRVGNRQLHGDIRAQLRDV